MRFDQIKECTNKPMNNDTYALRRQVMDIIYTVKKKVSLPRITVRIAERDHNTLGLARMNDNIIWICENSFRNEALLYSTVLHEILHAVKGTEHNSKCDLMCENARNISKDKALRLFLGYFN